MKIPKLLASIPPAAIQQNQYPEAMVRNAKKQVQNTDDMSQGWNITNLKSANDLQLGAIRQKKITNENEKRKLFKDV